MHSTSHKRRLTHWPALQCQVLQAVGLTHISMHAPPSSLSDGYKRRLALAVQLVRRLSAALRTVFCCG
jgi:energy-coupling factor transporter ATP-binding protein EcfA2